MFEVRYLVDVDCRAVAFPEGKYFVRWMFVTTG